MVRIGARDIGRGRPCFVIAEAGVNHDGRLAQAHALVDAAAEAGADAVKFQTWRTDALVSADARKAAYQRRAGGGNDDQAAMLRALELPFEAFLELRDHAHERGLVFLSTPFDSASARFLADELGVPAFKVGSGDLTNTPFLRLLAAYGRPLLLSTGMADLDEVAVAVEAVGNAPLMLFHCVSAYPAPTEQANLRALHTLAERFGVPVGFSDHSLGFELALAAVTLGAVALEKHLTLDTAAAGPDHAASCDPASLTALIASVRRVETALGDGVKKPAPCEADVRAVARRSLHLALDVCAGTRMEARHLVALRPALGLPPGQLEQVIGRRATRDLSAGQALSAEDLA